MKRLSLKATTTVLVMLCLMYFITYVDRVNISTAAGQFKSELGLSNTQLGIIFSAFAYPYVIFQFVGGWVSDRFGARRTLLACAAIWAVATALTGMAGGFASLIAARLLLGLGEGATFPASTSAMAARSDDFADLPCRGDVLQRNERRPDVGDSDGRRLRPLRHGQRHHERHRLHCGDREPSHRRVGRRPVAQLGSDVRTVDRRDAFRHRAELLREAEHAVFE
ncbi:hypothetical protein HDG37_004161 [Paraburkholderia sp. MM5384-R2]|nr:hypothetical protein [Paraburkholderia sp. MM5384-R2]